MFFEIILKRMIKMRYCHKLKVTKEQSTWVSPHPGLVVGQLTEFLLSI